MYKAKKYKINDLPFGSGVSYVLKNEKENMKMKIQTKSFIPYILHVNKRCLDNNKNEIYQ